MGEMRHGKATGEDEISTEMIKAGGPVGFHCPCRVLRNVWMKRQKLEDRRKCLISPTYKEKG
jgi:hypothetical protein